MTAPAGHGKVRGLRRPTAPRPLAVEVQAELVEDADEYICEAQTVARRDPEPPPPERPSVFNRRLPHEVSRTAVMALQPDPQRSSAPMPMHAPPAPTGFAHGSGGLWLRPSEPPASYPDGFATAALSGPVAAANTGTFKVRRGGSWLWTIAAASAAAGLCAFAAAMMVTASDAPPVFAHRTAATMTAPAAKRAPSTAPVVVMELDPEPAAAAPVAVAAPAVTAPAVAALPVAAARAVAAEPPALAVTATPAPAQPIAPVARNAPSPRQRAAIPGRRPLSVVQTAPAAAPAPPSHEDEVVGAAATHAEGKGVIDSAL